VTGVLLLSGCVPEPDPGASSGEQGSSATPSASSSETAGTTPEPSPAPSGSSSSTTTPDPGEVLIVTASAVGSSLEVSAMVPDVSESDGTCTLEVLDTGETAAVAGNAGNGVTYCGLMTVEPSGTDPSGWRFRVTYESAATQAQSAVSSLEDAQ
jgi:hypothetical protein